jgi:hypothetical protein
MHRWTSLRKAARTAATAAAGAGLLCLGAVLAIGGPPAQVLLKATGEGNGDDGGSWDGISDFSDLVSLADNLTDAAMIPTIAIAPLAAVAGAFALMIGGGGRQGSGGVKLIGGAIGAVVVVAAAKGLAY